MVVYNFNMCFQPYNCTSMTQLANFVFSLSHAFPKMNEKGRSMQKSCYVTVYFCTYLLFSNWNKHCKIIFLRSYERAS